MDLRMVECTNGVNWGKFGVGEFTDEEWQHRSVVDSKPLISTRGWSRKHVFILDLQTGEGAMFSPGGSPHSDLQKTRIWVCPLFEPFLAWTYDFIAARHGRVEEIPDMIELPDAPGALYGHRRPGKAS